MQPHKKPSINVFQWPTFIPNPPYSNPQGSQPPLPFTPQKAVKILFDFKGYKYSRHTQREASLTEISTNIKAAIHTIIRKDYYDWSLLLTA